MRKENFFTKNPHLFSIHLSIMKKRRIEQEWDLNECLGSRFIPATPFSEVSRGVTPSVLSFRALCFIVFAFFLIIPVILFSYSLYKTVKRRQQMLKEHRKLQYEISSTFPCVFEKGRDRIVGNKEEYRILTELIDEGVVVCTKLSSRLKEEKNSDEIRLCNPSC